LARNTCPSSLLNVSPRAKVTGKCESIPGKAITLTKIVNESNVIKHVQERVQQLEEWSQVGSDPDKTIADFKTKFITQRKGIHRKRERT
jgi:hypothetical protein